MKKLFMLEMDMDALQDSPVFRRVAAAIHESDLFGIGENPAELQAGTGYKLLDAEGKPVGSWRIVEGRQL